MPVASLASMLVKLALKKDLKVGDSILPADSNDGAEGSHVEAFQLFHTPAVKGPGLTTVQEG